jgi:hypothetical protein
LWSSSWFRPGRGAQLRPPGTPSGRSRCGLLPGFGRGGGRTFGNRATRPSAAIVEPAPASRLERGTHLRRLGTRSGADCAAASPASAGEATHLRHHFGHPVRDSLCRFGQLRPIDPTRRRAGTRPESSAAGSWRLRSSRVDRTVRGAPRPAFSSGTLQRLRSSGSTAGEHGHRLRDRLFGARSFRAAMSSLGACPPVATPGGIVVPDQPGLEASANGSVWRGGASARRFTARGAVSERRCVLCSVHAREAVSGCAGLRVGLAGLCDACTVSRLAARVRPLGGLRATVFIAIVRHAAATLQ